MLPYITIFLCLTILLHQPATANTSRLRRTHQSTAPRSRSLVADLRIAFGGIFAEQHSPFDDTSKTVYCKANQGLLGSGSSSGGGSSGNSSTTVNSSSESSFTSPSPSSSALSSTSASSTESPSSTSASTFTTTTTTISSQSPSSTPISTPWKLVREHAGESFFDRWDFWTLPDPTSGYVEYISEVDGRGAGLVSVNSNGQAIMAVDATQIIPGPRKSIRITTQDSYNGFLVIMDAEHMPTGCATWPAFWSNGPNWPAGGEIDIVEGIHDNTNNQAALHTVDGCSMGTDFSRMDGQSVTSGSCLSTPESNTGCGIRANSGQSFGAAFNRIGGGVYATRWDENGIYMWFFERGNIPADIDAQTPQPSGWGNPFAVYPASSCDPFKFFYENVVIFDTTLCGVWAGNAWEAAGGFGQEQSCRERTGYATCEDFVRNSGSSFAEAYWRVNYVRFYQKN